MQRSAIAAGIAALGLSFLALSRRRTALGELGASPLPRPPRARRRYELLRESGNASAPDGWIEFGTDANGAGCVVVRVLAGGGITLSDVVAAPGWTDDVKSAGGAKSGGRIEVRFTEFATRRIEARIQLGRTDMEG